jgi:retron-type reverse transcriptase
VVDLDLAKFFDRVNHDILMSRVAGKVKDKRVLHLIRSYLFGKLFVNFSPAASNKAVKSIRETMREWRLHLRSDKSPEDLAGMFNSVIRGWINYFKSYYKSAMSPTFQHLDRILARWAMRKYKKLKGHQRRAVHWLARIAREQPKLFAHWQLLQKVAEQ